MTPDLVALKSWLGIDAEDTADDVVLQESLDAALAAQANDCAYPLDQFQEPVFAADLRTAVFLRAQRLAARRNSPEGIVGLSGAGGEFVGARLAGYDADVSRLEGPYLKIVVG